jgi:hypothetical protein
MTEDPFSGSGSDGPPESAGGTRRRKLACVSCSGPARRRRTAMPSRPCSRFVAGSGEEGSCAVALTACVVAGLVAGVVLVPAGRARRMRPGWRWYDPSPRIT